MGKHLHPGRYGCEKFKEALRCLFFIYLEPMPNLYSTGDILTQLDACAKNFNFPVLDNGYIYPITSRMTVFGDLESWVIVVECVGYHYRFKGHDGLENSFYMYGNRLPFEPGINYDFGLWVTGDSDEGSTFMGDQFGTLDPGVSSMMIRETKIAIPRDRAWYASRDVELADPAGIRGYELLRAVLPEYRGDLLATDEEICEAFRQELPKLLQLDEWYHPDIIGEEKPSENETFQLVAAVLAAGDAGLYQPARQPNNHWRNWPFGGKA
jgi:hypothetical protein